MSLKATMVVAVYAAMLWTHSAYAGPGTVLVVGNVKAADLKVIAAAAEQAARNSGWTLAEKAFEGQDAKAVLACFKRDPVMRCLAALLSTRSADRILVLEVGPSKDGAATLMISGSVATTEIAAISTGQRFCKACTAIELANDATDLAQELIRDAATEGGRTVLAISVTPVDAWVHLDGASLAPPLSRLPTYPGKHTLRVQRQGYQPKFVTVEAIEGKTTDVVVQLEPVESARDGASGPIHSPNDGGGISRLGLTLTIAGVATAVVGGVLFSKDEDLDPAIDPNRKAEYRDSATAGVVVMSVGAVVAVTGVYFLLTTGHRGRSPMPSSGAVRSGPTATALPGGGWVGWTGAF